MPERDREAVTVIGAGLVGSLLASFLARRGYEVELFERRADPRVDGAAGGRSINLAVSARGLHALEQLGLTELALGEAMPMRGRTIHPVSGPLAFQPYGQDDSQCIYSVSRHRLNELLLTAAEGTGRVRIHFGARLLEADLDRRELRITREGATEPGTPQVPPSAADRARCSATHSADVAPYSATMVAKSGEPSAHDERISFGRLIGTDGSASILREAIARANQSCVRIDELDYGYKEIRLDADASGRHRLEKASLHIWPRGNFMLIALPNFDGSFTCTLFLAYGKADAMPDEPSFASLQTLSSVEGFFARYFPDALGLIPDAAAQFFAHPTGHMTTVYADRWHAGSHALLLGDAAHAIVPFFGQGMNAGFEDCSVLDALLAQGMPLGEAFAPFSVARKPDADAIAQLALENFVEMRDKVGDAAFLRQKQVERILQARFPSEYIPRYSQVTFSRVPYRQALAAGRVQDEILAELCANLREAEAVDVALAARLVEEKLRPRAMAPASGSKPEPIT